MDFFFPQNITCIICQKPIDPDNSYSLCRDCFEELTFIKEECHKCGKPIINRINVEKDGKDENFTDEDLKKIEDNCIILAKNIDSKDITNLEIDDDEDYILEKFPNYKDNYGKNKYDEKIEYSRCRFCENKRFYFDRAISCIEYCDKSKVLVLSLKYYGNTYMARYIAQIMKDKLDFEQINTDYIIPVPLHKKRMKIRGFNQSEKISRYLSNLTKIPLMDCIKRNRNTKRLYSLNKIQREKELKNAFEVKDGSEKIKGKKVLLIDDIFTTGTTVNEISKKLRIYGAEEIVVLTFLTRNIN